MQNHIKDMIVAHPRKARINVDVLHETLAAVFDCAHTTWMCADACLGEPDVRDLVRCMRLATDCAEHCMVTGRFLARQTELDVTVVRPHLELCATACDRCGAECERHAKVHEHCRISHDVCRHTAERCRELIRNLP